MRRISIFLVTVVFLFSLLAMAGCGGDKKDSGSQTTTGQQANQTPAEESIADLFAKGKKIEGMSFDFVMTMKQEVMNGKMWIQGDKVKSEVSAEGNRVITIFDSNVIYTYIPDENTAIKFVLSDFDVESEQKVDTPFDYVEEVDNEVMTQLKTETYDGVKCRVLVVTEKDTGIETKMWVREDYGIPVRVETVDQDGTQMVMEYKNVEVGALPEDTFTIPAGVEVQDMSEMMQGLNGTQGN